LEQAKEGRIKILKIMNDEISKPNDELSKYAPKIITFKINPDKIKDVIGSGGKVINKIIEETGVKIDIEDDGSVFIGGQDIEKVNRAKEIIEGIIFEPEIGAEFTGTVLRIMEFGAFVKIANNCEGMVHISKLSPKRVEKVTDIVNVGDIIKVKVIKIDEKGRIDLQKI
jgi:polyribonucleotide nucleotidyltransferase